MIGRKEWENFAGLAAISLGLWTIWNYVHPPQPYEIPPISPCPANQLVEVDPANPVRARIIGGSTPWLIRDYFRFLGGIDGVSSEAGVSADGLWGGTISQIQDNLPTLLGPDPENLSVVFAYVARNEADFTRGKEMSSGQIEAAAEVAHSGFLWLTTEIHHLTGSETRVVGVTLLPPLDDNKNVLQFEKVYDASLFRDQGKGYSVLDLRGCRIGLRDLVHPDPAGLGVLVKSTLWMTTQVRTPTSLSQKLK